MSAICNSAARQWSAYPRILRTGGLRLRLFLPIGHARRWLPDHRSGLSRFRLSFGHFCNASASRCAAFRSPSRFASQRIWIERNTSAIQLELLIGYTHQTSTNLNQSRSQPISISCGASRPRALLHLAVECALTPQSILVTIMWLHIGNWPPDLDYSHRPDRGRAAPFLNIPV